MKKVATDIKIGETIGSPHTSSYWGIVDKIEETAKKITFHITFVSKENEGRKWCYSFFKTTKVRVK